MRQRLPSRSRAFRRRCGTRPTLLDGDGFFTGSWRGQYEPFDASLPQRKHGVNGIG
jgi:hypothetical protein